MQMMHAPSPSTARTLLWLLAAIVPVIVLLATYHLLVRTPSVQVHSFVLTATLGSAATAALAALAAFELSQPGRSAWWSALPAPAIAVWLTAAGARCAATLFSPDSWGITASEALECLQFIIGVSLPLSVGLIVLVRRAKPERPALVGATGGLAIAAAATTLMALVHPHDSAPLDVVAHGLGIAVVVAANGAIAGAAGRPRTA